MIEPYKIKALVGSLYRLKLPTSMRIHDVFHSNLLQKAATDPLPGQHNNPEPPVVIDGEEEWEVDDILDAKRAPGRGRKVLFRVKWKGYNEDLGRQGHLGVTLYHPSRFVHDRSPRGVPYEKKVFS